jgi:hypothetical protein
VANEAEQNRLTEVERNIPTEGRDTIQQFQMLNMWMTNKEKDAASAIGRDVCYSLIKK